MFKTFLAIHTFSTYSMSLVFQVLNLNESLFQYVDGKDEIDVRMRSFSQNGVIRSGRPRSDCFVASEAQESFSYSRATAAIASSVTSSPSFEPLIPDKG